MSQSAIPQEENMAAISRDDIRPVILKFFSRLPVDKWESLNKSSSDDGIKIYVAEFILDLVDVLAKSLLVALKNNNFIISEEVVWSILGNTLPQTIADFLDIKDMVECVSATRLTRLLVKEAVTSVKSAVSCNSQAEGIMESEHVTSHHRLDVMVGHAIHMLRTIGAKMKGLFRFRLRKEKRAMETSTDGQKGDDVNKEKSHESSGPSKTSETGSAHSKTSEGPGLLSQKPQLLPSIKPQGPGLPSQTPQLLPSIKPQGPGLPTQKPQSSTIPSFKSQGPGLPSQRPNLHSLIAQGPYLYSLKPQAD
ncbi:hypothetical protein JOQ06_021382 [Pogonophryne albipinna]|uniref:Uncharacterized protein n=1 Tax=Pogonophryne albipinna TaxID=1090488 RepID=A0AAD6F481_9TELE|nr:hypothetical protein JOQ06_021382 [Pogonophryne albipinna]